MREDQPELDKLERSLQRTCRMMDLVTVLLLLSSLGTLVLVVRAFIKCGS
jgi:hypothetical protein